MDATEIRENLLPMDYLHYSMFYQAIHYYGDVAPEEFSENDYRRGILRLFTEACRANGTDVPRNSAITNSRRELTAILATLPDGYRQLLAEAFEIFYYEARERYNDGSGRHSREQQAVSDLTFALGDVPQLPAPHPSLARLYEQARGDQYHPFSKPS